MPRPLLRSNVRITDKPPTHACRQLGRSTRRSGAALTEAGFRFLARRCYGFGEMSRDRVIAAFSIPRLFWFPLNRHESTQSTMILFRSRVWVEGHAAVWLWFGLWGVEKRREESVGFVLQTRSSGRMHPGVVVFEQAMVTKIGIPSWRKPNLCMKLSLCQN